MGAEQLMPRQVGKLADGFAILRDDGCWFSAKTGRVSGGIVTFWRLRIRDAAIFDAKATATEKIAEIEQEGHTYEIVPVDREKVFRGA